MMEERIIKNSALDRAKWFVAVLLIAILTIATILMNAMLNARNRMSPDVFTVYQMNHVIEQEKEKPADLFAVRSLLENKGYASFDTYDSKYRIGWIQEKTKLVLVEDQMIVYPTNLKKYEMENVTFLKQDTIQTESELLSQLEGLRSVSRGWFSYQITDDFLFHMPLQIQTNACIELDLNGYSLDLSEDGLQIFGKGVYRIKNGDITHDTNSTSACLALLKEGSLYVENCTITSSSYGFVANQLASANVQFYHCQMDCLYPFYISAAGNYKIKDVTATGESVFSSGNISLENSSFISNTIHSMVSSNDRIKEDFTRSSSECHSYGDAVLIIDRLGSNYRLESFSINRVIFCAATLERKPIAYGLRYIDLKASTDKPIQIMRKCDSFPQVEGDPKNVLGGYTFA